MINRVVLVGRITRDPELQQTTGGVSYVRFSLACDRPFKNQNGDKTTDFINCIAWRNQAEFLKNYVKKGNMIGVEGRIQMTTYQDQNGNNRQSFDVFAESVNNLEPKKGDGFQPQPPFESGFAPANSGNQSQSSDEDDVFEFEVSQDDTPW
jgi:single-strand DNA-binding protein